MPKKYIFSLQGVNIQKVENKYGLFQPLAEIDDNIPVNTTKIDNLEIFKKTTEKVISFLDESKKIKKCFVSSIDFDKKGYYKCYWDKNLIPENVYPIGCPIKFISNRAIKCYQSEINKERYTISEQVSDERYTMLSEEDNDKLILQKKGFYETTGIFCSFNCCLAFIDSVEIRKESLYRNSASLLAKMYNDINEQDYSELLPAPDWRLLIDFGGHLTIEQFRESFNKVEYFNKGFISCVSLGYLFEDKLKF